MYPWRKHCGERAGSTTFGGKARPVNTLTADRLIMDKPRRRYSSESRSKGFDRHGSVQAKKGGGTTPSVPSSARNSSRPVDPRRAQPRGFTFHSFRIPKRDGNRSPVKEAGRGDNRGSSSWASRSERGDDRHQHSGGASSSDDRDSVPSCNGFRMINGCKERREKNSEEELHGRDLSTKPTRPSSLHCVSEGQPRKRVPLDHRTKPAESKRRRVGDSSEEEGGSQKSLRARLAEDRGKVYQLGTRQPTEVATLPGPVSGSPPRSSAQKCSLETVTSPEPPPPGVSPEPQPPKRKRGRPRKDSTLQHNKGKVDVLPVSQRQAKQKEEPQLVVILSDYSSTDEWPIAASPPPQSLPIPMSCIKTEEDDSSISTGATLTDPLPGGEANSSDVLKPPAAHKEDSTSQVSQEEAATGIPKCHHKDSAGKRCCNPALGNKRLCKCHYSITLKLQEELGLLVNSSAEQESSESEQSTGEGNTHTLETEPVSPATESPPESPPTKECPPILPKEEPPSPTKFNPPQQVVSVKVEPEQQAKAMEQTLPVHPAPAEASEVQKEARDSPPSTPAEVAPQIVASDNEGQSVDQIVAIVLSSSLRVVSEQTEGESKSAAPSLHEAQPMSELDKLNVKEQSLTARLVSLRKEKSAKEKEVAALLQVIEKMKQEIQQTSTEWSQVNEARRQLLLEGAAMEENCSAGQRQQHDVNETQDVHTTGSPVPPCLTTPSAQPQQTSTAPQAASSSASPVLPPSADQALQRLFPSPHTSSVLDTKVVNGVMITTSRDHTTHLYHIASGCLLGSYEHHAKAVTCLAVSSNGSTFVTGSNDCTVLVYLLENCAQPVQLVASSKVLCLKVVGNIIVAGLENGRVQVFRAPKANPLWTVRCYDPRPITAIDANRNYLVVGTTEESTPIMYWRLQDFLPASGAPVCTNNHCLSAMEGNILSLQLHGESTLFSSTSRGHVLIHDLSTCHLVHCLHVASSPILCVQATDRGHLFISTLHSSIKCFSMKDYTMKGVLQMHHPVYRFSVLQNLLYYGDNQGTVGVICTDSITQ